MKKVKHGLRAVVIVLLLMLAAFGIGFMGNFLNNNRERYMDNEIRIENTNRKEEEEVEEQAKE